MVGDPDLAALLAHARALVGTELGEIADGLGLPVPHGQVRTKGWPGQILERELGVEAGGVRGPDFAALGIELKTVPVDTDLTPRESTAVCQIDPIAIAAESWETSYVRDKLRRVLFVALEVPPDDDSVGARRVAAVRLWSPDAVDERALRADFELFVRGYFRRGRTSEITGHLGQVHAGAPQGQERARLARRLRRRRQRNARREVRLLSAAGVRGGDSTARVRASGRSLSQGLPSP